MTHELKCWPLYFNDISTGKKSFEIRLNDRNFKVGDTLRLCEWDPTEQRYTEWSITREVVYITVFPDGLRDGYVCMGLK